jgi:hypothetical protein
MNRKILMTVLALSVVLFAAPYVGMVYAKPPTTVSGTITTVPEVPVMANRGKSDNAVLTFDPFIETWFGDISADVSGVSVWEFHGNPVTSTDWTINIHEKFTFSNAVFMGKSGTLYMALNLVASLTGGTGHWTIIGGTGELANLHGHGTISLSTYPYTYTGQVHFDP